MTADLRRQARRGAPSPTSSGFSSPTAVCVSTHERGTEMFVSEFQSIRSGEYFGRAEHPSRQAAEEYAVKAMIRLGEAESDARSAAAMAGWGCADASWDGYGVRIFEEK